MEISDSYQVYANLFAKASVNPLMRGVSGPRQTMATGMASQTLVIERPDYPRFSSGQENVMGEAAFDRRFEHAAVVHKVIRRYARILPDHLVPESLVIYEDFDRPGEFHVVVLDRFHCMHQTYGFEFAKTEDYTKLMTNQTKMFEKNTQLLRSPNFNKLGQYCTGREMIVVEGSFMEGTEDGYGIRKGLLEELYPTCVRNYDFECGERQFPLNVHGTPGRYIILPHIGTSVSKNDVLCATRRLGDNWDSLSNLTARSTCVINHAFDRKICVPENSLVSDIRVNCDTGLNIPPLPVGMDEQLLHYWKEENHFYTELLDFWCELYASYGAKLSTSPRLDSYLKSAIDRVGISYRPRPGRRLPTMFDCTNVSRVKNDRPIAHWSVEVQCHSKTILDNGAKITERHASKGVVVSPIDDAKMPRLPNGLVADLIVFDVSMPNRSNPARAHERYFNAASCTLTDRIRLMFGVNEPNYLKEVDSYLFMDNIKNNPDKVCEAFDLLIGYYQIIAPKMVERMRDNPFFNMNDYWFKEHHVSYIVQEGVFIEFDPNTEVDLPAAAAEVRKKYPPYMGRVSYVTPDGKPEVTKKEAYFGSWYMHVLEKTGKEYSAAATAKLTGFGLASRLTTSDKDSAAGKQQITKIYGETDLRLLFSVFGSKFMTRILTLHNNPQVNKQTIAAIMNSEKPTAIQDIFTEESLKSHHRVLEFVKHIYSIHGFSIVGDEQ